MRIYFSPIQAVREIERDLKEMGIEYVSKTVQDKRLSSEDGRTKELIGYGFQVGPHEPFHDDAFMGAIRYRTPEPLGDDLAEYFRAEFESRTRQDHGSRHDINPGRSWEHRRSMWAQYRDPKGRFQYTYHQRMFGQWPSVLQLLMSRPDTRHAIIHFFDGIRDIGSEQYSVPGSDAMNVAGQARVPCSMYYQFLRRGDQLHMIYSMRSCDFINHFSIDLCMALAIQQWVAQMIGSKPGLFTMNIGSLHAFRKDVSGAEIF